MKMLYCPKCGRLINTYCTSNCDDIYFVYVCECGYTNKWEQLEADNRTNIMNKTKYIKW